MKFFVRSIQVFLVCFFVFSTIVVVALILPTQAQAQTTSAWKGVCVGTGAASDVATIQGFQCLIGNVLSVAITLLGLAGFAMLIIGSFKYMLYGSSAKGTEDGKNTITFAIAGLILALSAYFILQIIAAFTGISSLTNFQISTAAPNNSYNNQLQHLHDTGRLTPGSQSTTP